jgi:hypothetical protein
VEIHDDSSRRMAFYSTYTDGQLVKEWSDGLPATSMRLYVNAWYPAWLDGRESNKDKYVLWKASDIPGCRTRRTPRNTARSYPGRRRTVYHKVREPLRERKAS